MLLRKSTDLISYMLFLGSRDLKFLFKVRGALLEV